MSVCAAVARYFLDRRVAVELVTLDHTVPFDVGQPQLHRILRTLALVELQVRAQRLDMTQLVRQVARKRQQGELCVLVTPWEDPFFVHAYSSFTRVLRPDTHENQHEKDVA